jgi:hypothetical protein
MRDVIPKMLRVVVHAAVEHAIDAALPGQIRLARAGGRCEKSLNI